VNFQTLADAIGETEARIVTLTGEFPRDISRDEALDIALRAAAYSLGFSLTGARLLAGEWVEQEAAGTLPRWFIANPSTGRTLAFNKPDPSLSAFAFTLLDDARPRGRIVRDGETFTDERSDTRPPMGTRFAVLNPHEITRRIEALYAAN
jgi:hypothetical protein